MLNGGLSALYRRVRDYVIVCLVLALGVTATGWYTANLKLDKANAQHQIFIERYRGASKEAYAKHLESLMAKELDYKYKANEADEAYRSLSAKYRDITRLYSQANPARSSVKQSVAAPSSGSAESDYRPGEDTELPIREVVIPSYDLLICAENTARLMIARDWALDINN